MKKLFRSEGFTLAEVMVALFAAAILAIVVSTVIFCGYMGWTRLKAEAELQSDADVAMRTMDRIGRTASNATWSASTLTFFSPGGNQVFSKSGANLKWNASTLITNRVNLFVCVVTNNSGNATVSVTLRLVEGTKTNDMGYSIFLRN